MSIFMRMFGGGQRPSAILPYSTDSPEGLAARWVRWLVVDGSSIALDTITTPVPFEVVGVRLNPVTRTRKPMFMTVWGIWKRLDPLPVGQHVLRFAGGDGYGFTVRATYHLSVT